VCGDVTKALMTKGREGMNNSHRELDEGGPGFSPRFGQRFGPMPFGD